MSISPNFIPRTDVTDQRFKGQYEPKPTDTAHLAGELFSAQNTTQLIADFDKGQTPLRDVGKMSSIQRQAILEAFRNGTIANLAQTHPIILSAPVFNLHQRVVSGAQDQPIGHNFFVNASHFLRDGMPWAIQFNNLIKRQTGFSIYDISRINDDSIKDMLLKDITENPKYTAIIAVYLAGRSLAGEQFLKQEYGRELEQAKANVFEITRKIGEKTNLRIDMLERSAKQIYRTTFGSFDHLDGLVTSYNTGAAGDYYIGSLRVEVMFVGDVRSARSASKKAAYHIVAHELHHAGSAQVQNNLRCGLQVNGFGLEVNEGMTEYLAQLSIGSPGIRRLNNGVTMVENTVPYQVPVIAMLELHQQYIYDKNNHFATLFNAYHGDIRNQAQLEGALNAFYEIDETIAKQIRQ